MHSKNTHLNNILHASQYFSRNYTLLIYSYISLLKFLSSIKNSNPVCIIRSVLHIIFTLTNENWRKYQIFQSKQITQSSNETTVIINQFTLLLQSIFPD